MENKSKYTIEQFEEVVFSTMLNSIDSTIEMVDNIEFDQTLLELKGNRLQTRMKLLKIIIGALKGQVSTDRIIHVCNGKMFDLQNMKQINDDELANIIIDTTINR